jgi:anti-sigma factor RsiW
MRKETLEELIQLDLDGRATPEQRLAIAEALEHDPEARAVYAEMREVQQMLDRRPKVHPPEDLRHRIASEVNRLSTQPTEAPPLSRFAGAQGRHQRVMRFTLAAAAVLTLAVLLVPALVRETDSYQMRGTMASPSADNHEKVVLLAGNGIEGVVFTAWEGAELVLRPELRSPGPGRLDARFAPGQLKLLSGGSSEGRSTAESGLVTAILDSNPSEIRFLRRSGDPLSLSLTLSRGESSISTEVRFGASTNFSPGRL